MTAATSSGGTRNRVRGAGGWIGIGVGLLVIGAVGAVIATGAEWSARDALDPESAGPTGMRALAEVLRDQGVDVVVERDRAGAAAALDSGPATLVLPDPTALSDDSVTELTAHASDVVLIDPRARTLDLLLPGSEPAGVAGFGEIAPECRLDAADRAGGIEPGAVFHVSESAEYEQCYPSGSGVGLVVGPHRDGPQDAGTVAAVDGEALFTNQRLAVGGNAALALNLLGAHPRVVWYVPSIGDSDLASADPSLGELTPPWVSPVLALLLAAGIAAAIWRGRRFGPLVAERLPVTVRASETSEGRGRLYARSRDAAHAADQLRLGALGRIARLLGLGPGASAPEIADAASALTGLDRAGVRAALIDETPAHDADLIAIHSRIRHIEDAVRAARRPEGTR